MHGPALVRPHPTATPLVYAPQPLAYYSNKVMKVVNYTQDEKGSVRKHVASLLQCIHNNVRLSDSILF